MGKLLKIHNRMEVKLKNKEQNKKIICRHIKEQDIVKKIMDNKLNL